MRVVIVVDVSPGAKREIPEGHEPEIVPRVSVNALGKSYHQPDPKGLNVAPQHEGAQKHRQGAGE